MMVRQIRVLWDDAADKLKQDAKNTKNAIPTHNDDGEVRWITWPDRFDKRWVNGVMVLRCRFCGEYWLHGECECEVGRP